jgi:ABC-type transport system involved in cytochrome c biogenesis permease component
VTLRLPILALFTRSLRVESRASSTYLKRMAFLALILLCLVQAREFSPRIGAPGLAFFSFVLHLNVIFISLAGLTYFASAITEEKEEETLGLLKMSGLNSVSILLGKSTSRLLGAVMLLLVQLPFALLAITLGGVALHQIVAAYATLLAYTVFFCNLALFCSVASRGTPQAAGLAGVIAVGFLSASTLVEGAAVFLVFQDWAPGGSFLLTVLHGVARVLERANPFVQLHAILQVGSTEHPISFQVLSNLALGLACFLLAWWSFGFFTREQKTPAPVRGFFLSRRGAIVRWLGVGRPWRRALAWKDFHFLAGGRLMLAARIVAIPAILALIFTLAWENRTVPPGERMHGVGAGTMVTCVIVAAIEVIAYAARFFQDEVRWGTLPRLMLLPLSARELAAAKLVGLLPALAPYACYFVVGALLWPVGFAQALGDVLGSVWGWFVLCQYVAFVHCIAYLSLVLPRSGAVVALGVWVVGNFLLLALFQPGREAELAAYCVVVSLLLIILTAVFHVKTLRRIERLAGQ